MKREPFHTATMFDKKTDNRPSWKTELIWTIAAPLVLFHGVRSFSLMIATLVAALPLVCFTTITWIRHRRLSLLGGFAVAGLVLFIAGDYLTRETGNSIFTALHSIPLTAGLGMAFIVTAIRGYPLTLYLPEPGSRHLPTPAERQNIRNDPDHLRGYRIVAYYWGAGVIFIAIKEIGMAWLLPLSVFMAFNGITSIALYAILALGTPVLIRYLQSPD